MQVKKTNPSPTNTTLTIVAEQKELDSIKEHVLSHFQDKVKIPGFRSGKVPNELLKKNIDQQALQTQFLEEAVEQLYISAAQDNQLRPVNRPQIDIKKFVPFSTLEFEVKVEVIGRIDLPDYLKIKKPKPTVKVADKDIKEVLTSLQNQFSEKTDVSRAAELGDNVFIDFVGKDAKTKEAIEGADGNNYGIIIGSNTFIPGFEDELVGLKADQKKSFNITFPKDYGSESMAGRKVIFDVNVIKVQEVTLPKLDDTLAAKAGPFNSLSDLKKDISVQLSKERQNQSDRNYESELIKQISDKSKVDVPQSLIDEQVQRLMDELKQNLIYKGQTIQEFLKAEGKDEDSYKKKVLEPRAHERVKASLVLSQVAEQEKLNVTAEELEARMQMLRAEYQDPQMQAELNKPEAKSEIASRILTEKTVNILVKYATK